MAAPKTINEYDMALHAHREMGGFAEHLDYSVEGGSYSAVVNAALADYGVAETSGVKGVAAVALMGFDGAGERGTKRIAIAVAARARRRRGGGFVRRHSR